VPVLGLLGVTWQRPWLALLLAVPVLIWLLAARRDRSTLVWTGTLALWSEAQPATERARASRRPPLAVRFLVAALAAAVLALAGPGRATAAGASVWTVVVDRSPSMYLPWNGPAGATRIEHALARARELLDAQRSASDSVLWISYANGIEERASGVAVPQAWLTAPRAPQLEPPWSRLDEPGALWVTDGLPQPEPHSAGWIASGGSAVPGSVAAHGTARVEWDGERLFERAKAGPRPAVFLEGWHGPLERVVRAWADARECTVVEQQGPGVVLELVRAPMVGGDGHTGIVLPCGRDGWTWDVGFTGGRAPAGNVWLATADGKPAIVWEPGRITLVAASLNSEPAGDPADFALSWSDLLDTAALPPQGVVELRERIAAGAGSQRPPLQVRAANSGVTSASWLLAILAALLSFAALWQRKLRS